MNDVIIAEYIIESEDVPKAANALATGQSIGNPSERSVWETPELFETHGCKVLDIEMVSSNTGRVLISFPVVNTDFYSDGVAHLLCQLMGGQLDIGIIKKCQLVNVELPKTVALVKHKQNGIDRMRGYTKVFDRPLLGGILKPKTGLNPDLLRKMVSELVEGGVNFIKEDEIMSNLPSFPLRERVGIIRELLEGTRVVYCHTVNADPFELKDQVSMAVSEGANGIHVNVHSGLGAYASIRRAYPSLFLHYQKSGDKLWTNKSHDFHISWYVLCKLAAMCCVDTIHVGMIGGYSGDNSDEVMRCIRLLQLEGVLPALSCGFHPGIVGTVNKLVGDDYLANVGGALHAHPGGSRAGTAAMRQAIDGNYGSEYREAIKTWGTA